ncbi:MAG: endonuclease/exonuclease/phosphatase family protein [Deltaproteobacteria bacterium]|nr:endonuclease/exonuclease/phosphatase family protein [Deltaproteobacteria bacterium]
MAMRSAPTLGLVAIGVCAGCALPEASFLALTYNVAGLPEGLSGSSPERNTPLISPLLEPFELVLVQEDFTYHDALVSRVTHPHRSTPKVPETKLTGDGLNVLSRAPFSALEREAWAVCNGGLDSGSDCLAEKGFLVATFTFADSIPVDIYDLHCDAGGDAIDIETRSKQIDQLLAAIERRSKGQAVIVAGDTNLRLRRPDDVTTLERLKAGAQLSDACLAVGCGDEDHIDRFLFRSSDEVVIQVESWSVAEQFVDEAAQALSDHPAISVRFRAAAR